MTKVASKSLSQGSWAMVATANFLSDFANDGEVLRDVACELRSINDVVGSAAHRQLTPDDLQTKTSLSLNGGAVLPAGGGEVSLWCQYQGGDGYLLQAQIMIWSTTFF